MLCAMGDHEDGCAFIIRGLRYFFSMAGHEFVPQLTAIRKWRYFGDNFSLANKVNFTAGKPQT